MRLLTLALIATIVALQSPLWFGKRGWLEVHALETRVDGQRASNDELRRRNAALDAEVRDLKEGYAAIEERARSELGMIRRDEVFFQILETPGKVTSAAVPAAPRSHP